MSKIFENYMVLLLSQLVRLPLSLLSLALLVRLLGPQDYGTWAMIIAGATFFHSFLLNWTQLPFVRFGKEEWEKTGRLDTILSGRWPLITVGLLCSCAILFYQPFDFLNQIFIIPTNGWILVFFYLVGLWLSAEVQSIYQIKQDFYRMAITQIIIVVLLIVFFWSLHKGVFVFNKNGIMIGIIVIMLLYWLGMGLREAWKIKPVCIYPNHMVIKEVFVYGWALVPSFLIGYVSDWGDHLLLGYFLSTTEVGLFQASYQLMLAAIGLCYPLTTVLLPHLITRELDDSGVINSYLREEVPAVFVLWGTVVIPLVFLLPEFFLVLMGGEYREALSTLAILEFAIPGACLSSLLTVLFSIHGRLHIPMFVSAMMAAINIGISLLLIPRLGLLGAGIGTAVSYVIGQSLYLWDQARFLKVNSTKLWFTFAFLLGATLLQAILINRFWIKMGLMILITIIYIFVARYKKVITGSFLEQLSTSRQNRLVSILKAIFVTD